MLQYTVKKDRLIYTVPLDSPLHKICSKKNTWDTFICNLIVTISTLMHCIYCQRQLSSWLYVYQSDIKPISLRWSTENFYLPNTNIWINYFGLYLGTMIVRLISGKYFLCEKCKFFQCRVVMYCIISNTYQLSVANFAKLLYHYNGVF